MKTEEERITTRGGLKPRKRRTRKDDVLDRGGDRASDHGKDKEP